ncbi:MAG TPA: twin-arginine translocase TatA/TatE family subunit [Solirubrobacteraceae bacterium]|jgi:sec-independent protein translocase protein TatA|nr:twin-arginine translocase TatA/TatE family subunit [Solirubrobacteraceae bacterium]
MGLDNPIHIAFLLILLLLVFGAKRLPEMGRSLGSGMRGFKDALGGEHDAPSALATAPPAAVAPVAPPVAATAPIVTPAAPDATDATASRTHEHVAA